MTTKNIYFSIDIYIKYMEKKMEFIIARDNRSKKKDRKVMKDIDKIFFLFFL